MIVPILCPICKDSMENEFRRNISGAEVLEKSCRKRIDHKFTVLLVGSELNKVSAANLEIARLSLKVHWFFENKKQCFIQRNIPKSPVTALPFFEPDFSNYPKLLSKIKTYIAFS